MGGPSHPPVALDALLQRAPPRGRAALVWVVLGCSRGALPRRWRNMLLLCPLFYVRLL
jgi:hypothetical protein